MTNLSRYIVIKNMFAKNAIYVELEYIPNHNLIT